MDTVVGTSLMVNLMLALYCWYSYHFTHKFWMCTHVSSIMHALYCIAVIKVLYPLVIEQLLKHERQKRNLKKRKMDYIAASLCG